MRQKKFSETDEKPRHRAGVVECVGLLASAGGVSSAMPRAPRRAVAQHKGVTIGDYFLELTLPAVNKDYAAMLRELEKGSTK